MAAPAPSPGVVAADVLVVGTGVAGLTAALFRRESRGAHFRRDFPLSDESWRRRISFSVDPSGRAGAEELPEAASGGAAP